MTNQVSPLQDKPLIVGQAIVSSMNGKLFGSSASSIADIFALKAAAVGSPNSFLTAMANNNAWKSVSGTYNLSQADVAAFFSRFDLKDVVDDRGLNALRAVDASTSKQAVFVAGASFPNEFVGVGVSQTNWYGGSVIQGKALVDAYSRWQQEGVSMVGSAAVCNSLGGSTLAMAIPNLNLQLGDVTCFGGYGLNQTALNRSSLFMAANYGVPAGFSGFNEFDSFMTNVRTDRNIANTNITNYQLGDDWIPTFQSKPFGSLVMLASPYPSAGDGFNSWSKGLTKDHVLSGYWNGLGTVENNPSPEGITYTVTAWTKGLVYQYSNGVTYTWNVADNERVWQVPDPSLGLQFTYAQKGAETTITTAPLLDLAVPISKVKIKPLSETKFIVSDINIEGRAVNVQFIETFNLANEGASAGYSITSTTNNSTGVATYQLKDASGNPVASGSNYTVAQNNTIVFDTGTSKQVYDLNTGRLAAQIDADGSGFIVGANGIDTFYTSGQLAYNANSGVLTSTVGSQSTEFFGITQSMDTVIPRALFFAYTLELLLRSVNLDTLTTDFGGAESTTSPLVLDLNGDGVQTTRLSNSFTQGVHFNLDATGLAENTAWVDAQDGLLVRDLNADGQISSGRELFGNHTLLHNGARAANGFEALTELDDNADGVVDANDALFASLKVWKDTNSDGVSELGIASFDLNYQQPRGPRTLAVGTHTKRVSGLQR